MDAKTSALMLDQKQDIYTVARWSEVKWKSLSHIRLFVTPWTIQYMELSRPEYWSGQTFPSPEDLPNPGLPHGRQILYQLGHKGSPRILEWVSYPFSRGSSRPRNWTRVCCIAGGFFTNWAIREALKRGKVVPKNVLPQGASQQMLAAALTALALNPRLASSTPSSSKLQSECSRRLIRTSQSSSRTASKAPCLLSSELISKTDAA